MNELIIKYNMILVGAVQTPHIISNNVVDGPMRATITVFSRRIQYQFVYMD